MTRAHVHRHPGAAAHPEWSTRSVTTADLELRIIAKVREINEALVETERVLLLEEELGEDFHSRHYQGRAALLRTGAIVEYEERAKQVVVYGATTVVYKTDTNRVLTTHNKFTDPIKMRQEEFARAAGLTQSRETMYVGATAVRGRLGTANYQKLMRALQ